MPSGTVTFLFTDIESSTHLWEEHPQSMGALLAEHDRMLRSAIEVNGGFVFSTAGDAFSAAFHRVGDAANAAVAAQVAVFGMQVATDAPLRVRMALHVGAAEERDGDYFGPALNRCARVLTVGWGGQILVSQAARELLEGVELVDLGEHRLKDLTRSEHVWQLRSPGLIEDFPPLRSLNPRRHNLPVMLTSFVGRDREIGELEALLYTHRLVTVTGPGGVGKTRLAVQVASEVTDRFADGVWLVELAAVSTSDVLALGVRSAMGLPEQPGRSSEETLEEFARTKTMLVVLDNCEHLLDSVVPLVERMLRAGTESRVLATSRELLGLSGERVLSVSPLALPLELSEPAWVRENPAVALFLDRADQAGFRPTDQQLIKVAAVCRRLDGLPLALELAAARLRGLSLEDVAVRLENRFRLLTSGNRSTLPRQQTLENAIAWSYDLLENRERTLFARLGVFADNFDLAAAEATAGYPPLDEFDVADLLARLVDRSMVTRVSSGEAGRYRLLESLRQFGLARLTEFEDETIPRHRHAQHFRKWALANGPEMRGPGQIELYQRIDRELLNIRTAITWSLNHDDSETAVDLAGSLWWHWQVRGRYREGLDLLGEVVAAGPPFGLSHARLLTGMGLFATELDLYDLAEQHFDAAEDMARRGGYQGIVEEALSYKAFLDINRGNTDRARAVLDNVIASAIQGGRLGTAAEARFTRGQLSASSDEPEAAAELAEALDLAEQAGDIWLASGAAAFLGRTLILAGDFDQGIRLLERSRGDLQAVGDPVAETLIATAQAIGEIRTGRFTEAQSSLATGLEFAELSGSPAQDYLTMVWVADWLEQLGRHAQAARLSGALHSILTSIGFKSPHAEQAAMTRVEAACRNVLGINRFDTEHRVGEDLDLRATLAFARQALADVTVSS
ncbi:MAG TPA: adenylate/guanylate cyclase domain-containing protein [Acidimicrobiia bacterium]|nr:adenylate/guanylate cyclase domain-containing protein [Acidimicrobiia bacterium]